MTAGETRAIHTLRFGTLYVGRYLGEGIREDLYSCPEYDRPITETRHAAGPADVSALWPIYPQYDSRCGWCWLNASHTYDAHMGEVTP